MIKMTARHIVLGFLCVMAIALFYTVIRSYNKLLHLVASVIKEHYETQRLAMLHQNQGEAKRKYDDRRRHARKKPRFPLAAKICCKELTSYTKALNISYGGALLKTSTYFPPGAIFNLNLQLPMPPRFGRNGYVNITARVVYVTVLNKINKIFSRTFHTGVEFLNMNNCDSERLVSAVDRLSLI